MATLASVARERKKTLRLLLSASKKLDAQQEILEREIKRLVNRKKAVPETEDALRLTNLAKGVDGALTNMVSVISSVAQNWGGQ